MTQGLNQVLIEPWDLHVCSDADSKYLIEYIFLSMNALSSDFNDKAANRLLYYRQRILI
jgi:hypothetical protein